MKTFNKRLIKAYQFYRGARQELHLKQLAAVGFSEKELDEGGQLIRRAFDLLGERRFPRMTDAGLLKRLDEYQSLWFPRVRATLERNYPELANLFFAELVQLGEGQSPISVGEFLATLARLGNGETPFGDTGIEARALLAERTLTPEVEAEGNALLKEWNGPAKVPATPVLTAEIEKAVASAWKWRVEWADYARTVITSRNSLRELGIGRKIRKSGSIDAAPEDEEPTETAELLPSAEIPVPAQLSPSSAPRAVAPSAHLMNGSHLTPGA